MYLLDACGCLLASPLSKVLELNNCVLVYEMFLVWMNNIWYDKFSIVFNDG
jgi:hypothetical protein